MKWIKNICLIVLSTCLFGLSGYCQDTISLSGSWRFKTDPSDKGIKGSWFLQNLDETVTLPGSMLTNGKGDPISIRTPWMGSINDSSWFFSEKYAKYRTDDNCKVPFWLQPDKYYSGVAWYQKDIDIPSGWVTRQIILSLERCHWETRVWIDGSEQGMQNSLSVPHRYDLSSKLKPGRHTLSIRIDNSYMIEVGINASSITDHTQGNWNGMIGNLQILSYPLVRIKEVQLYPDLQKSSVRTVISILNTSGKTWKGKLNIGVGLLNEANSNAIKTLSNEESIDTGNQEIITEFPMGAGFKTWSEFEPNLYEMNISLTNKNFKTEKKEILGMREFKANGTQFSINGHPVFLRGTLDCGVFPLTGFPPMEEASWAKIFRIISSYGLNHIRFHSWCPPEAAFLAADKAGIYLSIECDTWAAQGSCLGDGKNIDKYLYEESARIIAEYGNHPSFCLMTHGNEPDGKGSAAYLSTLVKHWQAKDRRRLYTSGSGWPIIKESDYISDQEARIQSWVDGQQYILNSHEPFTAFNFDAIINKYHKPYISHEIGQWCVFPDFKEISKYTGVYKAKNFEIFAEELKENHMLDQANDFLMASGKLQVLCYKAEIEAALRTKGMAGFQLLGLHDFPGQGTALVGVLNAFWGEKGYITPEQYSKFCGRTVPLASIEKLVLQNSDSLKAVIEIAHFDKDPLKSAILNWKILNGSGNILKSGSFNAMDIAIGNGTRIGKIEVDLSTLPSPAKYLLSVSIASTKIENNWDFYVFPSIQELPFVKDLYTCTSLDEKAIQVLKDGGKVLLNLYKQIPTSKLVNMGFTPTFWNTLWFNVQPSHTLGILCNANHPVLAQFPSDCSTNWQWWDIITNSQAINFNQSPGNLRPLVQVIDTWHQNRKLGILAEASVGKGKLIIVATDFTGLDHRFVAKQYYASILNYMKSEDFKPAIPMNISQVKELYENFDSGISNTR